MANDDHQKLHQRKPSWSRRYRPDCGHSHVIVPPRLDEEKSKNFTATRPTMQSITISRTKRIIIIVKTQFSKALLSVPGVYELQRIVFALVELLENLTLEAPTGSRGPPKPIWIACQIKISREGQATGRSRPMPLANVR
jgi:hypothetical protein